MEIRIALAGNPNSGKTTMFNDLTGSTQYVGNWPGVTVERKEGKLKSSKGILIQDLPGVYSLSPYTLEEVVTRNYLIDEKPDGIINIVDASNIERNLFLTTQLTELGLPVTVALNMMDIVRKNGDAIDSKKLSDALGCSVVEASAARGEGTGESAEKLLEMIRSGKKTAPRHVFSGPVEHALAHIEEAIRSIVRPELLRWFAIKVFERDEKVAAQLDLDAALKAAIEQIIIDCETEMDDDSESIIISERYAYIGRVMDLCVKKRAKKHELTTSDKIDRIVTNRILALPIFTVVMFLVYFISVTTVGNIVTGFTNDTLFGSWISGPLSQGLESIGVAGWMISLAVDGIVGGVGTVLGFVPQMMILFFFLAVLEECGYMARVAFIMDRLFKKFGLSGKSFIPLLIGTGCSIPGIMASRTIENDRDRRMTVITTSFIPCGAKMPMIALIAGAMFGGTWWVAPSAYFMGIAAVIISGIILKKTRLFTGAPAPFVMELPTYHMPTAAAVLRSMWERGWSFIRKAGTIILVASVVIWFLSSFGRVNGTFGMTAELNESILAALGSFIAPVFTPLGFGTWEAAVATIMGLVAKEEVVAVFGVLYGVSGNTAETAGYAANAGLGGIAASFTALGAYAFMAFNLLCAPCFAAIGAIRREMNSAAWTWFAIGYQTMFAYSIALMIYQFGLFFSGGGFNAGTLAALMILALMTSLLARKGGSRQQGCKSSLKAKEDAICQR